MLDTGESSIFSMFWMPVFTGMTMLTAFDDCDTVSGGRGHEGRPSHFIAARGELLQTVRARPVEASFSLYPLAFILNHESQAKGGVAVII